MSQTSIEDPENNLRTVALVRTIRNFLMTIKERANKKHAVSVKNGDSALEGKRVKQKPERFIEEHYIRDCIEILGYPEYRPQPKWLPGLGDDTPDFQLIDDDCLIIGEIKKPNEFQNARTECETYLSKIEVSTAGIATDGFTWTLLLTDGDGSVHREQTARIGKAVNQIGLECLYEEGSRRKRPPLRGQVYELVDSFERQTVKRAVLEYSHQ